MTEHELRKLKDLAPPTPDARAKERALAAAEAAFAAAANVEAVKHVGNEIAVSATQGNVVPLRPTGTATEAKRSMFMRYRPRLAMAASVAAVIIAAPIAFELASTPRKSTPPELASGTPTPVAPRGDAKVKGPDAPLAEPKAPPPRDQSPQVAQKPDGAPPPPSNEAPKSEVPPPPLLDKTPKSEAPPATPPKAPDVAEKPVAPPAPPPAVHDDVKKPSRVVGELERRAQERSEEQRLAAKQAEAQRQKMERERKPPGIAAAPGAQIAAIPRSVPAPRVADEGRLRQAYIGERAAPKAPAESARPPRVEEERDRFDATPPNPVKSVGQEPVSTFSVDVDTASYSFVRRMLNSGRLPQKNAVRVEEMINYFPYAYPRPEKSDAPFEPTVTVMPAPWNAENRIVHIAIKGYDVPRAERPKANLVLLVDVSGSMGPEDRLPLLRNAFRMLVDTLQPEDTVSIVTYANQTRVALEPTKVSEKGKIIAAISGLVAGGGTYGEGGIQKAYELAEANFDKTGVNRIILATDGDFNIGITDRNELKGFIERKRQTGIFLSVIGVGRGNLNDSLMQALAQNGNGVAVHIDTLNEARKVLVEEAASTIFPIAKDVKVQFEFNPARVAEYRLIGYESRALKREDFSNDKVDAGDIGSGHAVTAIYEITPVGAPKLVEDLRYGPAKGERATAPPTDGKAGELGFLKIRYKLPKEETSRLIERAITDQLFKATIAEAPTDVRFSVAVAAFGQMLRGEPYLKSFGYDEIIALAAGAKGDDPFGYRAEMVNLVRLAKSAQP